MVIAALPYPIVLSLVGFFIIYSGTLKTMTESHYKNHWIEHHTTEVNQNKSPDH